MTAPLTTLIKAEENFAKVDKNKNITLQKRGYTKRISIIYKNQINSRKR
jgi:hypothetical protein